MGKREEEERTYRAAYPDDDGQPVYYRSSEDDVAYPDMVYQADREEEQPPAPEAPRGTYIPEEYLVYPEAITQKPKSSGLLKLYIVLCAAALIAMGLYAYRLYSAYGPFRQKVSLSMQDSFAQGVFVDGVNIGGMTRAQAEAAIKSKAIQGDRGLHLTVRVR